MKRLQQKVRKLPMLPTGGPHGSRPDYGKHPTQKARKPLGENAENSPIFYSGFKTVLADQV